MKSHFEKFVNNRARLMMVTALVSLTAVLDIGIARPSSPPPKNPALPEAGKTVYFKRHYSEKHLSENPGQKIEQIVIELTNLSAEQGYRIYIRALMKGEKRPVYAARGYLSESGKDSDVFRFQLDREAGRFSLEFHEEHVTLRLLESDFMTLSTIDDNYGQTGDDELLISFKATDKDHSAFKLSPAADDEIDF